MCKRVIQGLGEQEGHHHAVQTHAHRGVLAIIFERECRRADRNFGGQTFRHALIDCRKHFHRLNVLLDFSEGYPIDRHLEFVGNPDLFSRTHFARFLVESGRCKDVREVFTKYLVAGKPGYVPMQWASLGDSINWILAAGGIAIVAHPGRYRFNATELHAFLVEFKRLGGTGIEVVTGSHSVDQYRTFARHAVEFGFLASRGSDFHGPGESRIDLGTLPPLPDSVLPVWHDWKHGHDVH